MIKNVGKNLFQDYRYHCILFKAHHDGLFKLDNNLSLSLKEKVIKETFSIHIYFIPEVKDFQIKDRIPHFIINYMPNGYFASDINYNNHNIENFILFLNNNLDKSFKELSVDNAQKYDMNPKLREALLFSLDTHYKNNKSDFISYMALNIQPSPIFFLLNQNREHGITNAYLFEKKIKMREWKEIISKDLYPFRNLLFQDATKQQFIIREWLRYHLSDHRTNK